MATRVPTEKPEPLVLDLKKAGDGQRAAVGGKAANLAVLLRAGVPVPRGFCITTVAFDHFLAACPRRTRISELLSECSADRIDRIAELSLEAQSCLADAGMPVLVGDAVLAAWRKLGEAQCFAVRSSATVEDGAERSFAGQFESVLNVRGADALLRAIQSCWLSLFCERALTYQVKRQVPVEKVKMAVLVQEMVEAEQSGVVFTADPLTGSTDRLVVEFVSGLGEGLVQGTVQPDRLLIEKRTGRVLTSPSDEPRSGFEGKGSADRTEPGISPGILARLCELAHQTERLFGAPQDIEWAQRGGKLFLLQARPITTRTPVKTWEERQVWNNLNTGEVMPDVMTPVTWSMIQSLLDVWLSSLYRLAGADLRRAPLGGLVAGRVYLNINTVLATTKPFPFLFKSIPNARQAFGGGHVEVSPQALLNLLADDLPDLGFRWPKYILSWPRIACDLVTHSPRRGDAWLVRVKTQLDDLVREDIEAMSTADLTRLFNRLVREAWKGWDLLYLVTQAAALPVFQKACRDWLGDPDLTLGYRLFSALGGMAGTEAGLALWRLAVLAHADRETEMVVSSEMGWPDVRATLQQTEQGRRFLAAWEAFMTEHGHHCRGELELINARWSETPEYILGLVRGYLRSMGRADPPENQRRLADEREQLTEKCRRRLKNPIKRWIFSRSLRRAQKLAVNREELKNQAVRQFTLLRRVLRVLGQRLQQQGVLTCSDDIFFLEVAEIEPVAMGVASFNWRERIERRRREYEENRKLSPPPVVIGRFDPQA
ncbi:MAG TPA: PEP/pyruvate-binding domain-containing protein, partial [Verrucomicrobiae bacterium]|nr:PEP/pyruvate-binding domain-containing protein [Verrucomicrobiae bacterium]